MAHPGNRTGRGVIEVRARDTPRPSQHFFAPVVELEDTVALGAMGAFAPSGFEPRRGHLLGAPYWGFG